MNRRLCTTGIVLVFAILTYAGAQTPRQRHFTFTYAFSIRNPHPGTKLRIWFPKATSDRYQAVRLVSVEGDLPLKQTVEHEYGDSMFYAEAKAADKPEYRFAAVYEVTRSERLTSESTQARRRALVRPANLQRYREPDRLVPTSGRLAEIAAHEVHGRDSTLDKARAIYDYVLRNMRYDKTGSGWGRGDAEWACDSKRGNCTDFHSLFASMARSQAIPTRFEIGFPLPANRHEGEIAGYHCWSDFWVDNAGWVPIDISEAWKDQSRRDYFFGAHDENRVQFSIGRDLTLNPRQDGAPVNYFVYPYVESDGREFSNVSYAFSFRDR